MGRPRTWPQIGPMAILDWSTSGVKTTLKIPRKLKQENAGKRTRNHPRRKILVTNLAMPSNRCVNQIIRVGDPHLWTMNFGRMVVSVSLRWVFLQDMIVFHCPRCTIVKNNAVGKNMESESADVKTCENTNRRGQMICNRVCKFYAYDQLC